MKSVYIDELRAGDDLLNEPFLVEDIIHRETRDGRPYLLGTFRDRRGQMGGVFWDVPDDIESWIRPGLVALVTGEVNSYKNALQINVTDLNPSGPMNMAEFLPASQRSADEMIADLRQIIQDLGQPWQGLARRLLLDPKFLTAFANAPAARTMHHAYIGGLLEHTLSMATLAKLLARHYPYVNQNLLLTGVLLHDMGKVIEYSTEGSFSFSDDGRLVGHITRAVIMIELAAADMANFPEEDLRQLVHLVASHHGTHEWGSPVVPKTLDAILLHQLDLLDSRVQGFYDHLRNDGGQDHWSAKSSYMFNTELRRPPGFK